MYCSLKYISQETQIINIKRKENKQKTVTSINANLTDALGTLKVSPTRLRKQIF